MLPLAVSQHIVKVTMNNKEQSTISQHQNIFQVITPSSVDDLKRITRYYGQLILNEAAAVYKGLFSSLSLPSKYDHGYNDIYFSTLLWLFSVPQLTHLVWFDIS